MDDGGSNFSIGASVPKKSEGPIQRWFDLEADTGVPGFECQIRHISKRTIDRWARDCTKFVYNDELKRKEPKLNEKLLFTLYADHVLVNWRGLTVGGLRRLMVLSPLAAAVPDSTVVAATKENIINLLENSSNNFDVTITDYARNPKNFIPGGPLETPAEELADDEEETAVGNSSKSPSGS